MKGTSIAAKAEIGLYAVLAVISVIFIARNISRSHAPVRVAVEGTVTELADSMELGDGLVFGLAFSPSCAFCMRSLDYYGEIDSVLRNTSPDIPFVVLVSSEEVRRQTIVVLRNVGLPMSVVVADLAQYGISGVPVMLVMDSEGTIRRNWVGYVSEDRRPELLNEITAALLSDGAS